MSKITKQQNGVLSVPDVPTIPFITGDGVGAEITPAMQAIVDAAVDMSYGGAGVSNGKKYWPVNVLSGLPVRGCRTKRWRFSRSI